MKNKGTISLTLLTLFFIIHTTHLRSMASQVDLQMITELLDECLKITLSPKSEPRNKLLDTEISITPKTIYSVDSIIHRLQLINPIIPKDKIPFDTLEVIPAIKEMYIQKQIKLFSYILPVNHTTLPAEENFVLLRKLTLPQLMLLATLSPHNLKTKKQFSNPNLLSKDRSPGVRGRLYHSSWEEDFTSIDQNIQKACIAKRTHVHDRYIRTSSSEENNTTQPSVP